MIADSLSSNHFTIQDFSQFHVTSRLVQTFTVVIVTAFGYTNCIQALVGSLNLLLSLKVKFCWFSLPDSTSLGGGIAQFLPPNIHTLNLNPESSVFPFKPQWISSVIIIYFTDYPPPSWLGLPLNKTLQILWVNTIWKSSAYGALCWGELIDTRPLSKKSKCV